MQEVVVAETVEIVSKEGGPVEDDENQGEGADNERTVDDVMHDAPTEDLTQVTQKVQDEEEKDVGKGEDIDVTNLVNKIAGDQFGIHDEKQRTRRNPARNVKKSVQPGKMATGKTQKTLKNITKNATCRDMTEFLTWYADKRYMHLSLHRHDFTVFTFQLCTTLNHHCVV